MKKILPLFSLLLFFIGCGDTTKTIDDINSKITTQKIASSPKPNIDSSSKESVDSSPQFSYDSTFSTIRALIANAHTTDVTYICYGDSTRSVSEYENQYVFEYVKNGLAHYGVKAKNMSVTGMLARDAADSEFAYTNWKTLVHTIKGDGAHTILDISLGLNDYGEYSNDQIRENLRSVISSIRSYKPKTHFILTVPSRTYYNKEEMSNDLIAIYQSLANQFSIPLINVPKEAMPLDQLSRSWYREGDQTHLKRETQKRIADLILSKILP